MNYLQCVRCGLEIRTKPARAQPKSCPRCLARSAMVSPMVLSTKPPSSAVGWGTLRSDGPATGVVAPAGQLPATTRSAGASRRASQAALAAAIRDLRSPGRARPAR